MAKSEHPQDTSFAALPYRLGRHGLEILLITGRNTRGWVIPTGIPTPDRHPHRTAEIEAFQAAGVKGAISRKSIGEYACIKRLPGGEEQEWMVEVFPLLVANETASWRDKAHCRRVWFSPKEAAEKVEDRGLALMIQQWQETRLSSGRDNSKLARGRGGSRHG